MAAHIVSQLQHYAAHLSPAALLVAIIVAVVMLACALAPVFARKQDDNGLNYEGHR